MARFAWKTRLGKFLDLFERQGRAASLSQCGGTGNTNRPSTDHVDQSNWRIVAFAFKLGLAVRVPAAGDQVVIPDLLGSQTIAFSSGTTHNERCHVEH